MTTNTWAPITKPLNDLEFRGPCEKNCYTCGYHCDINECPKRLVSTTIKGLYDEYLAKQWHIQNVRNSISSYFNDDFPTRRMMRELEELDAAYTKRVNELESELFD